MKKSKGVTDDFRFQIIQEYLAGASKYSLKKKYNLCDCARIRQWMIKFGIEDFRCGRNIKIGVLEQFGFTSYRYQIHCKVRNLHRVWMNFSMTKKNEKSTHLVTSYINSLFGILFFHIFERSDCLLPDWRPLRWLLLLI
ncbi:MAG: hypothetical protein PHI48_04605 [Bacteroidales bacterium]|nr:hypothetical protein [Bacteroidales bacterium]MDD4821820.1 hypothetical protein [Bacteroidales bacterium]